MYGIIMVVLVQLASWECALIATLRLGTRLGLGHITAEGYSVCRLWAHFEIVILVPDSAMMRLRVPPPLPAVPQKQRKDAYQ